MISANELAECGRKNKCGNHLQTKKLMVLEGNISPIKKECFGNNKSHSLLSVDKCLSKSKDYLKMKNIIKKGRESIKKCIIQKCVKKTKGVRKRKPSSVRKRKPRLVRKPKPRLVRKRKSRLVRKRKVQK